MTDIVAVYVYAQSSSPSICMCVCLPGLPAMSVSASSGSVGRSLVGASGHGRARLTDSYRRRVALF